MPVRLASICAKEAALDGQIIKAKRLEEIAAK